MRLKLIEIKIECEIYDEVLKIIMNVLASNICINLF